MLPVAYSAPASLADVLASSLEAVQSRPNHLGFGPAERVVVILVDGLGAHALRARRGHSRFLAPRLGPRNSIESGFPTTTAAALASLATGVLPGQHGLVGYRVRDVIHDRVVNQLSGWDDGMRPEVWQSRPTVFENAVARGVPSYAVSQPRFRDSGFTRAVLRGAEYVPGATVADRFRAVRALFNRGGPALAYLYVPELDKAAHAHGWESEEWSALLETLDSETASFAAGLRASEAAVVTADHGIVDVPHNRQILYDTLPELMQHVRMVGGEPRCLQLYLEPDATDADRDELATAWRGVEGDRAWIATRSEAIRAGWFGGEVDPTVLDRIGDVFVAARKLIAYYPSSDGHDTGRAMIGQHGSLTPEEVRVPLIGLGEFDSGAV